MSLPGALARQILRVAKLRWLLEGAPTIQAAIDAALEQACVEMDSGDAVGMIVALRALEAIQ